MSGFAGERETAATLNFGEEFVEEYDANDEDGRDIKKGAKALMNDEVIYILTNAASVENVRENPTKVDVIDYIRKIAGVADEHAIRASTAEIRNALYEMEFRDKSQEVCKLHGFEISSLSNLIASEASIEEAIAWVPSLNRFDEESLNTALDVIIKAKSRLKV